MNSCSNVDESQMRFAECKNTDIYALPWERQNYTEGRWMAIALVWWRRGLLAASRKHEGSSG